jgi:predicted transcriptional regulator
MVAASALARERGGIPISRIAEELGRTELTIRNHLSGKTEAGKIVRETYEKLLKSGKIELPITFQQEDLKKRVEELEKQNSELNAKLAKIKSTIEQLLKEI